MDSGGTSLLGIEIGGTKLQLVRGDAKGGIAVRRRFTVQPVDGADGIRGQLAEGIAALTSDAPVSAVGVGFGGPFDRAAGTIARSYHIAGWDGFPLRDWLAEETHAPVAIDNDANVAALAEAHCGAGQGRDPVFYVTLGSGVGGGLVRGGAIYHGAGPTECEIGHLRLDPAGTIVQDRCSGWALDKCIRKAITDGHTGPLARLARGAARNEARCLGPALDQGDALAAEILDAHVEALATGLSHVVQLLAPGIIVLGGGVSLIGEPLRARLARALRNRIMDVFGDGPEIALARNGEDVVPVGALLLAAQAASR
jgi:glucokinase